MRYIPSIGLEVHVQVNTRSKMFCACSTKYGEPPNTQVCPVCLGYPGALPVINGAAVRATVAMGLMIGSRINAYSKFDRKSYFYPDMPKNYQISQYDWPLCVGGEVMIETEGGLKRIGVTRIHLEEDVAKNMHFERSSGVDFNRAGVPLMEIVSEPDMNSPEEAFEYLQVLKQMLLYAGVSDCNLERGNMRCDVNCSVRPADAQGLGVKTELKNLNTFKGVLQALRYEVARQVAVVSGGGRIPQETRRWDMEAGETYSMRSKEDAHDYRYFPDPDLVPVELSFAEIEGLRQALPEQPKRRLARFVTEYGLPEYDAKVLVADKAIADYFEATARASGNAKAASNWVMTEMLRLLAERELDLGQVKVTPGALAELIGLVDGGKLNSNTARDVFGILFEKGGSAAGIVSSLGLAQVSDAGQIEELVEQAMRENVKSVEDYRNGKAAAAKFLVGQVMKLSRGKANPQMVGSILDRKLR